METNAHGQPADPPLALRRPTVSAVICTVDRPVLLRQAIRSIREQRYDGVIETEGRRRIVIRDVEELIRRAGPAPAASAT